MATPLPAVERVRLDEQVYRALRRAIVRGELVPGQRLVQEELAGRLGTSRLPVRDALRQLERDGLVEADGRGTYHVVRWGPEEVARLYEVRLLLEPPATARAAGRLRPDELSELRHLHGVLEEAARTGDTDAFVEYNQQFHFSIYRACGNPRLVRAIEAAWSGLAPLAALALPEQLPRLVRDHAEILRHLEARSGRGAGAAMRRHVRQAGEVLVRSLRCRQGGPAGVGSGWRVP
ncbi:MAG: GntR family transcriptional regulator [Armatimonadota bacterium]|nr:GntR family transcriptional regulator [Armatimonadota bacterium]MDR7598363.1 GntR family transcriptional regulator [Armatimonadota bacterium]